jgi:hypothetical protein
MEITIEDVYKTAQELAPKVMSCIRLHNSSFSAEDVVSTYITKFLEKNYIERFDSRRGSLTNYVWEGIKNTALTMCRKVKREITLSPDFNGNINEMQASWKIHFEDRAWKSHINQTLANYFDVKNDIWLNEISKKIGIWKFGHAHSVKVCGEVYKSTSDSVLKLLALGFSKTDLSKLFNVSGPTISNVVHKMKNRGLMRSDIIDY